MPLTKVKKWIFLITIVLLGAFGLGYYWISQMSNAIQNDCREMAHWEIDGYHITKERCVGMVGPPWDVLTLEYNGQVLATKNGMADTCIANFSHESLFVFDLCNAQKWDSEEFQEQRLTQLVSSVLQWQQESENTDFLLAVKDTLFTGINWDAYDSRREEMKATGFFSQGFLKHHLAIAKTLDSSIASADASWRNINDGIPIWHHNANDWCGCQDGPDRFGENVHLHLLTIDGDRAEFLWSWEESFSKHGPGQKMTAVLENGNWKIQSVQGFSLYGEFEEYQDVMN
ncbi:MAG: hypothetical protein SchgKO_11170 [Schleiferiaceae bacterium]